MLESPPEQWPLDEGDDAARLLSWRGGAGEADATLEGALIMALRFIAGTLPYTYDTCCLSTYHSPHGLQKLGFRLKAAGFSTAVSK